MSLRVKNSGKITATQKDKAGGVYVKYPKSTINAAQNVIPPVENLKYKSLVIEGVSTDNNGNPLYGSHSLNPDSTIVDMYSQDKVGQWGQSSAYGVQINSLINGTLVGTKSTDTVLRSPMYRTQAALTSNIHKVRVTSLLVTTD